MAGVIAEVQRPALVMAHNKTLAAQLCNEFREFFPDNVVEYFVSYYDYYQPEAYVPAQDLYIEKDSSINDEIDRLQACRDGGPAGPPRRDHRRIGLLHLRHRLPQPLPQPDAAVQGGGDDRPRQGLAKAGPAPVRTQRLEPDPRRLPGPRRGDRDHAVLRRDRLPDLAVRRRDRGDPPLRPADRRDPRRGPARIDLAGDALRHRRGFGRTLARGDPDRARQPAGRTRGRRQGPRGPPAAASARCTTSR